MSVEQLRQSLKLKWLNYYRDNRSWLVQLKVWVTCKGQRRPSSSFILATLSVLEPRLIQLFPLVVELSNDPDRVVLALGLNFNPEEELRLLELSKSATKPVKLLSDGSVPLELPVARTPAEMDEACEGIRPDRERTLEKPDSKLGRKT